jgi:hypothetical protein
MESGWSLARIERESGCTSLEKEVDCDTHNV